MRRYFTYIIFLCFCGLLLGQTPTPMVTIKGGSYVPLYGVKGEDKATKPVNVKSFQLDIYPVTNAQYKAFLEKHPEWRRSRVKGIFAQKSYLSHWKSDLDFSPLEAQAPVTHISWFAAKKYCECEGKRQPTSGST